MSDFDLAQHLLRQRAFSRATFGPDRRTKGVIDHIRKELTEIEDDPSLAEWIDVIILAFDGAWRAGISSHTPEGFHPLQIIEMMVAKQSKNELRNWPDWRSAPADKAIEHVRT